MTIRVADVLTQVRRILQDEDMRLGRNSDEDIRGAMMMALSSIARDRPDAFAGAPPQQLSQDDDLLPLEFIFHTPLIYMTAGNMMLQNNEFARDGVGTNLIQTARSQLMAN